MNLIEFKEYISNNPNAKVYNSISSKPGKFGKTLHNRLYSIFNLNYNYLPLSVKKEEFGEYVKIFRENKNIYGCGVSMPFKTEAINYMDQLDLASKKIGNINTIIKKKNLLKGFNTDYLAIKKKISEIDFESVTIFGSGAISETFKYVLSELNIKNKIFHVARDKKKIKNNFHLKNISIVEIISLNKLKTDLFINASSVGFKGENKSISPDILSNFNCIIDIVSDPIDTYLLNKAKFLKKETISGFEIAVLQSIEQFNLYHETKLGLSDIEEIIYELFKRKIKKN